MRKVIFITILAFLNWSGKVAHRELEDASSSIVTEITGRVTTEFGAPISDIWVKYDSGLNFQPPFSYLTPILTDTGGYYSYPDGNWLLIGTFFPVDDRHPLNGVTTYDLVLISKHVLGIAPITSPYKLIAADANKSGTVTTFDIVELRKLILGIYPEFPNNTSWRFVKKSHVFVNPGNPFQPPFPEQATASEVFQGDSDFIGVKIGDLNNTVVTNATANADDRSIGEIPVFVSNKNGEEWVSSGSEIILEFSLKQPATACQFTLETSGIEVINIIPGPGLTPEHFAYFPDRHALTTAWEIGGPSKFSLKCRATQSGHLLELLGLSSRITRAEAYAGAPVQRYTPVLQFPVSEKLELYQNIPNPFNQQTEIRFNLPQAGEVVLEVFDAEGRLLHRESGMFEQGMQRFSLNSQKLPATGVIYYQVTSAGERVSGKMTRIR